MKLHLWIEMYGLKLLDLHWLINRVGHCLLVHLMALQAGFMICGVFVVNRNWMIGKGGVGLL